MQSHPLRSPLALARRPPALDRQSILGRLYTVGDYLAHEHADVIRQLTANNWRTPLPLPSHSRGRFTRKPVPWPTRAIRPFRSDDCVERAAGIRQSTDLGADVASNVRSQPRERELPTQKSHSVSEMSSVSFPGLSSRSETSGDGEVIGLVQFHKGPTPGRRAENGRRSFN